MSYNIARKAMDRLSTSTAKKLKITFFGGEPLLCVDLIRKIVDYGQELESETGKQISYGITSNGTLFNESILRLFNEHGIRFHLSIDGDAKTQDQFRRTKANNPTSHILNKKIPLLLKLHALPSIRMTVTPDTAGLLYENICYLLDFGFRKIAPVANLDADWTVEALTKLNSEWEKVGALYIQYALRDDPIKIKHLCDSMAFVRKNRKKNKLCGAGRNMVAVDPRGNIFPCHRFVADGELKRYSIGHVDIQKTLDLSEFSGLTVKEMNGCKTDISGLNTGKCSECQFAAHCSGGCIAMNAVYSGSIYDPVPNNAKLYSVYVDVAHRTQFVLNKYRDEANKLSA